MHGFVRLVPPPAADPRARSELADFIDEQAAFLVQKGIYDYARARSGPYAKMLLTEPEFMAALNDRAGGPIRSALPWSARWSRGCCARMPARTSARSLDAHIDLVLDVFDRYPVPEAFGKGAWRGARDELALRLDQIGTHPPKRVIDIPEQYVKRYFEMMPFDERMLTHAISAPRSRYLRLTLIHMRDELVKRMDAAEMAGKLRHG